MDIQFFINIAVFSVIYVIRLKNVLAYLHMGALRTTHQTAFSVLACSRKDGDGDGDS